MRASTSRSGGSRWHSALAPSGTDVREGVSLFRRLCLLRGKREDRECKVPSFCTLALEKPLKNAMSLRFVHPGTRRTRTPGKRDFPHLGFWRMLFRCELSMGRFPSPRVCKTRAHCVFGRFFQRECAKRRDFASDQGTARCAFAFGTIRGDGA